MRYAGFEGHLYTPKTHCITSMQSNTYAMVLDEAMPDFDPMEFFAERAAIMQYEGGLSRPDSEYFAVVLMRRYCVRMGIDEPKDHWMKSCPRAEWSDDEGKPVMKREPLIPDYRGRG